MVEDQNFEDLKKIIGLRVKKLRIDAGYKSYEVFAWDNKISRIQYWKMEKGTNCTIKSLHKVLKIHNIGITDFFVSIQNIN
jgi:hypothetical protein|tara:strand:- start:2847 stop:3089 length:243 start_codon:yes stop_codon:yes gene_type:complete